MVANEITEGGITARICRDPKLRIEDCSANAGVFGHNQHSILETTVTGATSVSFYWKVSSEADYDFLNFYVDGVVQARISGEVPWELRSFAVPAGTHNLRWTYTKDVDTTCGSDTGWVDQITFQ